MTPLVTRTLLNAPMRPDFETRVDDARDDVVEAEPQQQQNAQGPNQCIDKTIAQFSFRQLRQSEHQGVKHVVPDLRCRMPALRRERL